MIMSDLQALQMEFFVYMYINAVADKISANIKRRAVPLRQLNILYERGYRAMHMTIGLCTVDSIVGRLNIFRKFASSWNNYYVFQRI